jgi:hypothetical protein
MLPVALVLGACGSGATGTPASESTPAPEPTAPPAGDGCAHVVGVEVTPGASGYTFAVTVSSADTGWDKYADLWVVQAPDGSVLGERVLAHPHVEEQPFTRSQSGIRIPEGITEVTVAARDSVLGFCGDRLTAPVAAEDE